MVRTFLFFLLLFSTFSTVAQVEKDSVRLHDLLTKALQIRLNKPDSSIYYAKLTLEEIKPSSDYLNGFANYIISYSNWVKANYKLSAEYGFRSLRYMEKTDFHYEKSLILLELCRTFFDLKNLTEGKKYLDRSFAIARAHPEDERILANSYREQSFYFLEINEIDSALTAAAKGIKIYEQRGDNLNASVLYSRQVRALIVQKKFQEAAKLCRKTILLDSLVQNRRAQGIGFLQMATVLAELQKKDSAIYFVHKAIRLNKAIDNWQALHRSYKKLSELYVIKNKPALAIEQLLLADIYKDSLYNVRSSGQIEEMKILYETEKKDNTIALLEKDQALQKQQTRNQRLFVGFLLSLILFMGALLFVVLRSQRIQKQTNKELAEKNTSIEQQREEMQLQAEKLQELNHLKSKLFSVIGHDLRGPINSLQALLDLFTKNLLTQEEFIQHSDKLKASVNITQRTLENLLNWSLSQMEGIRTRPSVMDIRNSTDEAARLLTDIASRKNIVVENKIESALLVYADPDQVQLVLRNLIHNGIKFSKANSTVTISALINDRECAISVADAGIGMTSEEVQRLEMQKEHFTKIGTLQEKGTGLGFLLCREFIQRNDGSIHIQSESGKGTVITFKLPLA